MICTDAVQRKVADATGTPVFGKEHMLQILEGFFRKMTQDAGRDATGGGMVGSQNQYLF
jgi:hypothetical protein